MTRVGGRSPVAVSDDADGEPGRSRAEAAAGVLGVLGVLALLWSSPPARRLPVYALAVVVAVIVGSYLAWRWASVRLGRATAAAAVTAGAFLVSALVALVAPSCPTADSAGRCTGAQAAAAGLVGMFTAAAAVALTAGAAAIAAAVLTGGRWTGRGARAATRGLVRAEASRRERREAGVRWLTGSLRDPVVIAGAGGALVAGVVAGVVYRDAVSALAWAAGGALVGGGLPAAWRAGGRARELRAERARGRRRGRRPGRR